MLGQKDLGARSRGWGWHWMRFRLMRRTGVQDRCRWLCPFRGSTHGLVRDPAPVIPLVFPPETTGSPENSKKSPALYSGAVQGCSWALQAHLALAHCPHKVEIGVVLRFRFLPVMSHLRQDKEVM